MDHPDDVRIAQASPGVAVRTRRWHLRDRLAADGPVAAIDRLCYQGPPMAELRAEVRRVRAERVWSDMARAACDAQRDGGRIVIPENDGWPDGLADIAGSPSQANGETHRLRCACGYAWTFRWPTTPR